MSVSDPLSDQVFHRLLGLFRLHRQYARRILNEQNIKPRDISILRFLAEREAVKVSQIRNYIHHSPSTTSTWITKLEESGYVTRRRSETDRRVVRVDITQEGRSLLERTPLGGLPLLRRELQALPDERLAEMSGVLAEIRALMEEGTTA